MANASNANNKTDDDRDLALRAAAGSKLCFAALLERHYDQIHRLAWRFSGRSSLAEDIAHDVCVKLARAIKGFRGDAAFSTWLYRVIYTTATDHLRAAQRVQLLEPSNMLALVERTSQYPPPTPEDAVIGNELWAAVRELSPKQRDAVLLVYGEDLTHAEAGQILDCSEKTVSWHLHEAKKRLKTTLEATG